MVRVAGSLATGQVRAYDLIRMMMADGRLTGLGSAFAHYGRIFKTLHLLQVIHVEEYRRMIGAHGRRPALRTYAKEGGRRPAPAAGEAPPPPRPVLTSGSPGGSSPGGGFPED